MTTPPFLSLHSQARGQRILHFLGAACPSPPCCEHAVNANLLCKPLLLDLGCEGRLFHFTSDLWSLPEHLENSSHETVHRMYICVTA